MQSKKLKRVDATFAVAVLAGLALTLAVREGQVSLAQGLGAPVPALPEVFAPFPGDPRLEPIPDRPIRLVNFNVFAHGKVLTMRFPPRVNGQTISDGDGHSDMFVLFDANSGLRINQPPILEAVPKNAAGPGFTVSDLVAREFSPIWELHLVTVDSSYDPTDPKTRIDSAAKVQGPGASSSVRQDIQTNIFLNCPIVPAGTTVDPVPGGPGPNDPRVIDAFFEGQIVHIVPYDIEDGPSNPQILFKFEDANGNVLGAPHLVASRAPGDPFYSSIWEVWTVHVPNGFDATTLKSEVDIRNSHFRITSSGIRLNCPVVAIGGVPFPFEDAFALLTNKLGRFDPNVFPLDIAVTAFTKPRTHLITELNLPIKGGGGGGGGKPAVASAFSPIDPDKKGNVIPLILRDPFQLQSSGPNSTGDFVRINQPELDAAFANNDPPRLPDAIEANFAKLIDAGLLAPEWAPGGRTYQERLALVGRALFELVWKPEQGAHQKDVTRCFACHSTPASGGAARALYTLEAGGLLVPGRPEFGRVTKLHPGSMWGSGGSELLVQQKKARGENVTFAHGSLGQIPTIRGVVGGAFNAHTGIRSSEFIAGLPVGTPPGGVPASVKGNVTAAAQFDLDGEGIVNAMTVGEVTAVTVFLMALPVPDQIDKSEGELLKVMGIDLSSVEHGRRLFTDSIDSGGAACASCHTPFHPLAGTTFFLKNPETTAVLPLQVAHHFATRVEVDSHLASFVGQAGMRLFGDIKRHKMGSKMFCSGTDVIKTAELWDVGSVFPYGRCSQFGSDLSAVILAHEGVLLNSVSVAKDPQVNFLQPSTGTGQTKMSSQSITITNNSLNPIVASPGKPIRVVLIGTLTPGIQEANAAGTAPGGGRRQGAFWLIANSIPPGGSQSLNLVFENPVGPPDQFSSLNFDLAIQDDAGYSEASASIQAFKGLVGSESRDMINFLRVQLIGGKVGEGSGGTPPQGGTPLIATLEPKPPGASVAIVRATSEIPERLRRRLAGPASSGLLLPNWRFSWRRETSSSRTAIRQAMKGA